MREQLQTIFHNENGVTLYNPLSINWNTFKWDQGYYPHIINTIEIYKPYLISQMYYGTIAYEEHILLLNNIEDIFEIKPGIEIKIPKIDELKKFIFQNKKS